MADRVVVRWELDTRDPAELEKARLRRLMIMRRVALTMAFLAILSIFVLMVVVTFSDPKS